jgi:hypothetical protein
MTAAPPTAVPMTTGINTLIYPLPGIEIDRERIRAEFEAVRTASWFDQNRYRNKGWKGAALYSKSGKTSDLGVNYELPPVRTEIGEACPYIAEHVLPQFQAPWFRAGFYKLEAGATIGEHRDLVHHAFSRTMVRIHIPVITDPQVVMFVARRPYHLPVGSAWYFDPTALHAVNNSSSIDRIHLMVDFEYGPGINALLLPPTWGDRARFMRISSQYYVNRVVKPFYSRARNLWYGGIKRPRP